MCVDGGLNLVGPVLIRRCLLWYLPPCRDTVEPLERAKGQLSFSAKSQSGIEF